jgi:hypothetical protein
VPSPPSLLTPGDDPASDLICRRTADLGLELTSRFQTLITQVAPFDPANPISLGGQPERDLCTLCYAGAWFDGLYRTGDIHHERNQELRYAASTSDDLDDMLTAIPPIAITNMALLIHRASNSDLANLRQHTAGTRLCIPGPCFAGSFDVGGADADLIADDLLLESKAHANPAATACDTLRQLLGYLLLDYDDSYQIAQVGIYYGRHAHLIHWAIPDLLRATGCSQGIIDLRLRCAKALQE